MKAKLDTKSLFCLKSLVLHLCALTFIVSSPLGAQEPIVLYNTFGPGDIYDYGAGAIVSGPDTPPGFFVSGFPFVSSIAATVDTIQVAFGAIGTNTAFTLSLRAANGPLGGPGDVIETFLITDGVGQMGFPHPLITLRSTSRPLLNAATVYWLVATADADNFVGWNANALNLTGRYYSIQGGSEVLLEHQLLAAYRVNGIPIVDSDADGDGVADSIDECPATPLGVAVSSTGCSIEQLVPCDGNWRSHGAYVSTVQRVADQFLAAGVIGYAQRAAIVSAAAQSDCGKNTPRR